MNVTDETVVDEAMSALKEEMLEDIVNSMCSPNITIDPTLEIDS